MQSRVFSIFSVLTIAPPLIQQLQPRFLASRQIFQTRERNSKIYSWFAFVLGSTLVESPYSIVAGTLYMCCWYFGSIGPDRPGISTAYTWLLLMLFELFYVGFGQAIASFSPNELLASILVPMFFLFVVSFCGVVVPFSALPPFWRSWMYYLTPFRYLLEGFLGAAVSGLPVVCAENEFARFTAPPGLSCENYTSAFVEQVGGYVQVAADGVCEFCQYATGDEFVSPCPWFQSPTPQTTYLKLTFSLARRQQVSTSTGPIAGGTMAFSPPTASLISSSSSLALIFTWAVEGSSLVL